MAKIHCQYLEDMTMTKTPAPFDYSKFNRAELMQVATVLAITNPAHCGNTAEGLEHTMQHIVTHARAEYARTGDFGYMGTLGYVVSTYPYHNGADNETRFKVTVESWGVLQYLANKTGHHNEVVITSGGNIETEQD